MRRSSVRAIAAAGALGFATWSVAAAEEGRSPTFDDVARAFTIRDGKGIATASAEGEPPRGDVPVAVPIDLEILAMSVPSAEPGAALVPVLLEIPSSSLLGARRTGPLEGGVRIVATRQGQERAKIQSTYSIELSADDPLVKTGLKLYGELLLEPGPYRIMALVVESGTGARGQAATNLEIPEDVDRPFVQPLVAGPPGQWRVFRIGEETGEPFPFRSTQGGAYLPSVLPRIRAGSTSRLQLLGFGIPGEFGNLAAFLVNPATGIRAPVEVAVESESPGEVAGEMTGTALLTSPAVPPGRYSLELGREGASQPGRLLVEVVGRESPAATTTEVVKVEDEPTAGLEPEEIERRYRGILEQLRLSTISASARDLASVEIAATSREHADRQMKALSKIEENVLEELGRAAPEALLPILYLHVLLDGVYMRRGDAWRMGHNRFRLERFVELYVRRARSDTARRRAAKVLALMGRPLAALKLDPHEELALLRLGMGAERRGRYHSAVDYLRRLVQTRPSHAHGRLRLGIGLRRIGDEPGARQHLSRVAHGDGPDWIRSLAYQELAELMTWRDRAVDRLLRRAIEELDHQALYVQLAYYLDRRGHRSEALAVLNAMPAEPRTYEAAPRYRYNLEPEAEKAEAREALTSAVAAQLPELRVTVAETPPDSPRGSR